MSQENRPVGPQEEIDTKLWQDMKDLWHRRSARGLVPADVAGFTPWVMKQLDREANSHKE
jgi:hypothetical protein